MVWRVGKSFSKQCSTVVVVAIVAVVLVDRVAMWPMMRTRR